MKNQKILVDREPLSKEFIESKQDFGNVLSHVKNLKPPVWKTPWFYGPVGVAVVAITVSSVNINPRKTLIEQAEKATDYERILPFNERKIEVKTLAVSSPIEVKKTSIGKVSPNNKVTTPKLIQQVSKKEFSQTDTFNEQIKLEKPERSVEQKLSASSEKKVNKYPHIGHVYNGEIPLEIFSSDKGIECDIAEIQSFTIQYYNGTKEVEQNVIGKVIPKKICEIISEYNWGSMIFITDIIGTDENGVIVNLPSLNYTPH